MMREVVTRSFILGFYSVDFEVLFFIYKLKRWKRREFMFDNERKNI
jgi:hypothetical protein